MPSLLKHLLRPVPIVAVGASAVSVWATGLWWLVPVGLAAAGAAAALGARAAEEAPLSVPPPRPQLRPLLAEKARILAELSRSGGDGILDADEVAARVDRLVQAYDALLGKTEEMRSLLSERGPGSIEESIRGLERQLEGCTDEVARGDLRMALKHRKDEAERLASLARDRERVEAQLLGLASALTNLRVRLVQGRVSQTGALEPQSGVREVLESLFREVEVAEGTSRELNGVAPPRPAAQDGAARR